MHNERKQANNVKEKLLPHPRASFSIKLSALGFSRSSCKAKQGAVFTHANKGKNKQKSVVFTKNKQRSA